MGTGAEQPTPTAKPVKETRPIRFSGPAWAWIVGEAAKEDVSAPEFVRRLVDEARLRRSIEGQVTGRLTSLEERMADCERRLNGAA